MERDEVVDYKRHDESDDEYDEVLCCRCLDSLHNIDIFFMPHNPHIVYRMF